AILLPPSAPTDDLLVLQEVTNPPAGPAGSLWDDQGVADAARTGALLHPLRDRLKLTSCRQADGSLILETAQGTQGWWGSAPGREGRGESGVEVKLRRLLRYVEQHGSLDQPTPGRKYDVRTTASKSHD